mgnify:CR=1 FL=1
MTNPGDTPAAVAMARMLVPSTPLAANSVMAVSRIRAAVERSSVERMFNILNDRSGECKILSAYRAGIGPEISNQGNWFYCEREGRGWLIRP